MKELVSVRMITYNQEDYVGAAIESVLMQKADFPFELIIGEDCSTDKTREIVFEYANKYPKIIKAILRDHNIGMIPNGIQTLRECSGKYIALIDGDDEWTDPLKLKKQYDAMENNPEVSLCFHNLKIIFTSLNRPSSLYCLMRQPILSDHTILGSGNFIPTSSVMFRNHLKEVDLDWMRELPFSDWALHLVNSANGKILFIPEVMGLYRSANTGKWGSMDEKKQVQTTLEAIEIMARHFQTNKTLIDQFVIEKNRLSLKLERLEEETNPKKIVSPVPVKIKNSLINRIVNLILRYKN